LFIDCIVIFTRDNISSPLIVSFCIYRIKLIVLASGLPRD
jgi:hypothetical protein